MRMRVKRSGRTPTRSSVRLSDWLLNALNGSKVGLAIYDKGFHYVRVNSAIASMNSLPAEEHLGQTPCDVLGRTSRIIEPRIDRVFLTGEPVYHHEFSAKLPKRTDVGYWIQDYFPIADEGGRVNYVAVSVVEVTEQRRLEATIRHLRRSIGSDAAGGESKLPELQRTRQSQATPVSCRMSRELLFDSGTCPADILSGRELQVLDLLAQGESNKQVASALTISEKTVETYRSRIKLKLGLHSLVELVHYAIRHGIVKL